MWTSGRFVGVAPVDDLLVVEPRQLPEHLQAVAGAEQHNGVRCVRKCQIGDLVLDDEHPCGLELEARQLVDAQPQLADPGRQAEPRGEKSEADIVGFRAEPEPASEVGRGKSRVDRFGRERGREQVVEQHPMAFDELGVDTFDVDLA